jgi:hypothetical protein
MHWNAPFQIMVRPVQLIISRPDAAYLMRLCIHYVSLSKKIVVPDRL